MAMSFQSYINAPGLIISGLAATNRDISLYSGNSLRWVIRGTNSAESGSDAGTDFSIIARTDVGNPIDSPINIVRASAGQITIGGSSARLSVFTGSVNITNTLTLNALSTGTLINTSGVVSALSGTNLVLGNGSTIAQSTFVLSSAISGTTNKVVKFTSTSAIGNSNITDTGTLITLGSNVTVNGGVTSFHNAQECFVAHRNDNTVNITHGMDFSALNNTPSTVVYSKIRNSIVTNVAGSESSALFFYTKNNSVENKNFAIYKDYVSIGSVPFYQNDGGRVLIDAAGKGFFTSLSSAGTITFSAFTSAGFVKTNASGVLSVDTVTYIPYNGTLGISNLGANGISGWGYVVSSGTVISDGRGVNWRGGLVSNDSYFGIGQDATLGTDFKPFVIGGWN